MANTSNKVTRRRTIVQPYGFELSVIFATDPQAVYKKVFGRKIIGNPPNDFAARFVYDEEGFRGCMIFGRQATLRHIGHESFHAAHRIMEMIGHKIAPEGHEPHAYLFDHIFGWVTAQARKAGMNPR